MKSKGQPLKRRQELAVSKGEERSVPCELFKEDDMQIESEVITTPTRGMQR